MGRNWNPINNVFSIPNMMKGIQAIISVEEEHNNYRHPDKSILKTLSSFFCDGISMTEKR